MCVCVCERETDRFLDFNILVDCIGYPHVDKEEKERKRLGERELREYPCCVSNCMVMYAGLYRLCLRMAGTASCVLLAAT